jgi:hypothetical protein
MQIVSATTSIPWRVPGSATHATMNETFFRSTLRVAENSNFRRSRASHQRRIRRDGMGILLLVAAMVALTLWDHRERG